MWHPHAHNRAFLDWLTTTHPDLRLAEATAQHVQDYLIASDASGDGTEHRRLAVYAIRSLYRYLTARSVIPAGVNPAGQVAPPRQRRSLAQPWSDLHLARLDRTLADAVADAAATAGAGSHAWISARFDQTVLTTLRYTGLRIAELEALRLADVNLACGQIRVSGKGNKKRATPIPAVLVTHLKAYLDEVRPHCPDSNRLFANPRGRPDAKTYGTLPTDATDKLTRRHAAAAGLPAPHGAHRLRHSYATAMLRSGVSVEHIRQLLGHSELAITARYLHLNLDDLTDAVDTTWPGHEPHRDAGDKHQDDDPDAGDPDAQAA